MAKRALPLLCLLGGLLSPLLLMLPMEGSAMHPQAAGPHALPSPEEWLEGATVGVLPSGCAGAIVGDGSVVATVAHCVRREGVRVRLGDGTELRARVIHRDEALDRVLLRLPHPAGPRPLRIRPEAAEAGETLYFGAFHREPEEVSLQVQAIEVLRIGPCPSLPDAQALHTTLQAQKGDSGSPLVAADGALVGMVHGGARCQIATPAVGLEAFLEQAE